MLDGLVREVILVTAETNDDLKELAEETGARIVVARGRADKVLDAARRKARGDWALRLAPGTILPLGWSAAVRIHLQRAPQRRAAFRLEGCGGFRGSVYTRLFGTPLTQQAVIEPLAPPVERKIELLPSAATQV